MEQNENNTHRANGSLRQWLPLILAAMFAAGIFVGSLLGAHHRVKTAGQEKLNQVLSLINNEYVDDISIDSLVELAIPAIINNLDPHSSYIPASSFADANEALQGQFSGIGISFNILNDTLSVIEVINGGPSEKMGVLPGDKIIEVDGQDITKGMITDEDVRNMLRGEKGTRVKILVKRKTSKKPIEFEITRDDIPMQSVDASYMANDSTGYIKLSRFSRHTFEELWGAMMHLRLEGATNFVLDLRYNSGGYMEPAVLIANEFLGPGDVIVSKRGRINPTGDVLLSDGTGSFQDFGLAVLVNEFTASSSEILSGAIQDNDRGWIIGRRTFGKGLVQHPVTLPDSSELRLTVERYYTPSGRSLQKSYTLGDAENYEAELVNRFANGEAFSADSIKLRFDEEYSTKGGRKVYGGGGIMPDIFVPEDTTMVNSYYNAIFNQNLPMKFAYEYCDLNRASLSKATNVDELLRLLPSRDVLLQSFVRYAAQNGVPARWYYINISAPLIVNQIEGLIARSMLGMSAYYQVVNRDDAALKEALKQVSKPLLPND